MLSIRERCIRYLESLGYIQIIYNTRKYIVMQNPKKPSMIFLGSRGAVRLGVRVTKTQDISKGFMRSMIEWERGHSL